VLLSPLSTLLGQARSPLCLLSIPVSIARVLTRTHSCEKGEILADSEVRTLAYNLQDRRTCLVVDIGIDKRQYNSLSLASFTSRAPNHYLSPARRYDPPYIRRGRRSRIQPPSYIRHGRRSRIHRPQSRLPPHISSVGQVPWSEACSCYFIIQCVLRYLATGLDQEPTGLAQEVRQYHQDSTKPVTYC
jgi:hypothetical protein